MEKSDDELQEDGIGVMKYNERHEEEGDEVEVMKDLLTGSLEGSGVNYYVCDNKNPNESVVLTLIVHVGSLMEEEDEQGLAHFIEHLGFKSTKSFEHYELVKFLESLGISYGPDLNASTHLLETVFRLNIKYDEECSQISMGINVLSEWAYHMNISEKDVVEERQVIFAEYTAKQGLRDRLLKKYWKAIFDNSTSENSQSEISSALSQRFPIGIPEIFMNCDNQRIRRFYEKWYRPENMSVLVCGSLHGKQNDIIEQLTKSFQSPAYAPVNPVISLQAQRYLKPRSQYLQESYLELPTHHVDKDVVVAMVDSDLNLTQVSFEFFSPINKSRTTDFIRKDIIRRLMSSILDKRFNELHKKRGTFPEDSVFVPAGEDGELTSPFLSVNISIREFVRGLLCIGVTATLKDDQGQSSPAETTPPSTSMLEAGVQSLLLEMKRLRLLGINQTELNSAKMKWKRFFSQQQSKIYIDNAYMNTELQEFVLNGQNIPFAGPISEAGICLEAIDSITLEEMNAYISSTFDIDLFEENSLYYRGEECGQCFRAVSGQFPKIIDGSDDMGLRHVLQKARTLIDERNNLQYWPCRVNIEEHRVIEVAQKALNVCNSSSMEEHSKIIKETDIDCLICSEFILSNGITVCCKWMPENSQNKVSMQGFALGGSSELNAIEDLLMSGLEEIVGNSTVNISCEKVGQDTDNLDGKDILELQSAAHTRVNTQRHHHHRGIGGSTSSDKIELLLALLVIKLTAQGVDKIYFDDWIKKKIAQWKDTSNIPEYSFVNRSRVLACGDEPNFKPITLEQLQEASEKYECACELYDRAFRANPTEFCFVFTGDIGDRNAFKFLLEKYLGKLRPSEDIISRAGTWLPTPVSPPASMYPFTLYNSSSVEINGPICESLHLLKKDDVKSSMMLIFRADMRRFVFDDEDIIFSTALDATCRVLQVCLLDELRIKMGKVYNVHVEKTRNSLCSFFLISVGLYCQPSDTEIIKESVTKVLLNLQTRGPDSATVKNICEAMSKAHCDATSNSSYWLFWILDSYKAYKLHQWRCDMYPDIDKLKKEESCDWLARNGLLRATGKLKSITNDINCNVIQEIYETIFDINKSILMSLLPEVDNEDDACSDGKDDVSAQTQEGKFKERADTDNLVQEVVL